LVSEVQTIIDETSAPVYWTSQQVYNACNKALEEVWANVRWTYTTATITTLASQQFTTLPSSTVMIPQYIINDQGLKMFPTTHDLLQDWQQNWMNEHPARPGWYVLWDQKTLRWFPTPDTNYTFVLYGVPWPPEINGTNLDISVDPLLRRAVIYRAAAYLFELSQPQYADFWHTEAAEQEKKYGRQFRNQQGANVLRLRPVKGWELAQQGDIRQGRRFTNAPLSGN